MKLPINGSLFCVVEVEGPICRGGKHFPVRVCYVSREIHLLKSLGEDMKKHVLAAAISEACQKHRIPLIWPRWRADRPKPDADRGELPSSLG